jgi:carbon storage regulator
MLIISRKRGESFIIGENIKVSVLEVIGDRIKIGIEAPKSVKIMRSEVADTEKSNVEAVMSEKPTFLEIEKQKFVIPNR